MLRERIALLEAFGVGVEAAAPRRGGDGRRVADEPSVRKVLGGDEARVLLAQEDEREDLEDEGHGRFDDVVGRAVPERDDRGVEDVGDGVVQDPREVPHDLDEVEDERREVEGAFGVFGGPEEELVDEEDGEQDRRDAQHEVDGGLDRLRGAREGLEARGEGLRAREGLSEAERHR